MLSSCEVYSVDFSKMIGNPPEASNFNWLFRKLQLVISQTQPDSGPHHGVYAMYVSGVAVTHVIAPRVLPASATIAAPSTFIVLHIQA